MILLSQKTFDRFNKAIKYPSITGGRGVSVRRQPGGGVRLEIPSTGDGNGAVLGPPFEPDNPSATYPPGWELPIALPPAGVNQDPFAPDDPS